MTNRNRRKALIRIMARNLVYRRDGMYRHGVAQDDVNDFVTYYADETCRLYGVSTDHFARLVMVEEMA